MLRILIVDDMPIFLDYLRGCIDWQTYGFEICGEAHDGIEALHMIETVFPDIILTDITMPYMDGLELSEKVAQHYPDISVLLITGNNEFEYARRAVRLGVCDYIVKPFEKEELLLSLLKQKDNINYALESKTREDTIQRDLVLRKLILGRHLSWDKHRQQFQNVSLNLVSEYFLVGTMKFFADQLVNLEQVHNWETIIEEMLTARLEIDGNIYIFTDFENNIVILLNFSSEQAMKRYKTYELTDLKKIVRNQLHIDTLIAISDFCYSVDTIRDAYTQTQQQIYIGMSDSALTASGQTRHTAAGSPEIGDGSEIAILNAWDTIDSLTKGLEQLNEELILDTLSHEFERYRSDVIDDLQVSLLSSLVSILLTNIINSGRRIEDIYGSDFHPFRVLRSCQYPEDAQKAVTDYYIAAVRYRKKHSEEKSYHVVETVKNYIHGHYMDAELCIADIARETLINQTYLRAMFKQETSQTISEYIWRYRMTLAKQLIETTDRKLSAIAEDVGFRDVSYFSKSFKKYYGVSPRSYHTTPEP